MAGLSHAEIAPETLTGADAKLRLELDATHSLAGMGLASALTPTLVEAGMSTTITIEHVGDHMEPETRSRDDLLRLAAAAGSAVVYALRIYLPGGLTDLAVKKSVEGLDAAIRKWRRDNGNTGLTVPIYGPDGKTIIHTVDKDA
jgi:hypothetical protein